MLSRSRVRHADGPLFLPGSGRIYGMNTGHPISSAYLLLGVLIALGVILIAAAVIQLILSGGTTVFPMDPGLPYPVNVR